MIISCRQPSEWVDADSSISPTGVAVRVHLSEACSRRAIDCRK